MARQCNVSLQQLYCQSDNQRKLAEEQFCCQQPNGQLSKRYCSEWLKENARKNAELIQIQTDKILKFKF